MICVLLLSLSVVPDVVTLTAMLEENGQPVNREVSATFALWDAPVDGRAMWLESRPEIVVDQGLLVVELGVDRALDAEALAGPRWLEIVVDGQRLEPRTRIAAVPYAMQAKHAEEAGHAEECSTLDGLSAEDVVTHAELDLQRRILFMGAPGCGWNLSTMPVCQTLLCAPGTFFDCAGACSETSTVSCSSETVGWFLGE